MVRMIVFSVIAFGVAYLLYVFPVLALLSLFNGSEIVSLWSLLPTALVFLLIRLYLATSITNRALRAFVFYGMGVGFLSALILSVLLFVRWLGVSDGQVLGAIAVFSIAAVTVHSVYNANSLVVRDLAFASDRIGGRAGSPSSATFISGPIRQTISRRSAIGCSHANSTRCSLAGTSSTAAISGWSTSMPLAVLVPIFIS